MVLKLSHFIFFSLQFPYDDYDYDYFGIDFSFNYYDCVYVPNFNFKFNLIVVVISEQLQLNFTQVIAIKFLYVFKVVIKEDDVQFHQVQSLHARRGINIF
jgi:hypothetical protein